MDDTDRLLAERGKTHGDFGTHALITQRMKAAMNDAANWRQACSVEQRESLDMIVHKIGRILAGNPNHRDHWDDIAGYARLAAERCLPSSPTNP